MPIILSIYTEFESAITIRFILDVSQNTNFFISGDSGPSGKMAILDVVLGVFRVVVFVYDVITFPIYALAQQKWKDRTKQDLGKVSKCLYRLK